MKYRDGANVVLGDRILLGSDEGVVVFSVDTVEYDDEFPKAEWEYLESGFMVSSPTIGLIHIEEYDPALQLIARA